MVVVIGLRCTGEQQALVGDAVSLRARAWDGLVVVLVLLVMVEVVTTDQDVPLALSVPVGLAMTVPFVWGRTRPMAVAAVVLVAWVVQGRAGDWALEPQSELLSVCMAFWCLGAFVGQTRLGPWAALVAVAAVVLHRPDDAVVMVPLMVGVYGAGRLMQSRERLAQALREERSQAERYAVAQERARIARELHDVVGHGIATMTVQAGAERVSLGDARPETARVLGQIEQTGRQTLQEMRRLLGVLRTDEDVVDLTPQPGLAQLEALAERTRRTGLAVEVEQDPTSVLTPGVDISAYRIVQEALTNVLKHAGATTARIRVRDLGGALEIDVSDDGRGPDPAAAVTGHGLTGMRERVALYGGSIEVGRGPLGGWRLVVRLPTEVGP